jgi:hypothetical protein
MSATLQRLEHVGQIAFITMCVTVTAAAVLYVTRVSSKDGSTNSIVMDGVEREIRVELPAAVFGDTGKGPVALLVLSTKCRFCTESVPFYRRLLRSEVVQQGRLSLGVVSLQPVDEMRRYLAANDLAIERVIPGSLLGLRVRGTPTLVLLNETGVVESSWVGRLNDVQENDFAEATRRLVSR